MMVLLAMLVGRVDVMLVFVYCSRCSSLIRYMKCVLSVPFIFESLEQSIVLRQFADLGS